MVVCLSFVAAPIVCVGGGEVGVGTGPCFMVCSRGPFNFSNHHADDERTGLEVVIFFFVLNSTEHEIFQMPIKLKC